MASQTPKASATPKADQEYQQWIQQYLALTQQEQDQKKQLKTIQEQLSTLTEELQHALVADDVDEVEVPHHGILRRVTSERACPLTVAQRDERIHAFFHQHATHLSPPLSPSVWATRLIDTLQQTKSKSITEKMVWTACPKK